MNDDDNAKTIPTIKRQERPSKTIKRNIGKKTIEIFF